MAINSVTRQSLIASLGCLDPSQCMNGAGSGAIGVLGALSPLGSGGQPDPTSTLGQAASGISKVAQLLSSLAQLEQQDPEAFKKVTAEIAKDFNEASGECADPLQKFSLKSLAAQFSNAAIKGSLAQFNLAQASSTMIRAYSSQSSMAMLDALGSSKTAKAYGQMNSLLQTNLPSTGRKVTV